LLFELTLSSLALEVVLLKLTFGLKNSLHSLLSLVQFL
jgi:hypothetical protein